MDPQTIDTLCELLAAHDPTTAPYLAAAQTLATLHLADVVEAAAKAIADKLDAIERQLDLLRPT